MKPLVIFGISEAAEVAYFYFKNDSAAKVEAFTVNASYIKEGLFSGRPVVPFDDVEKVYPPNGFDIFVAMGYSGLNKARAEKCAEAAAKGYRLTSYVSSKATVWPGLSHGFNCFILEDNTIQPFVKIGNNVTLWSGNHIGHHSIVGDNCFITSHAVISGGVTIGDNCFIGVNAAIRDHVKIGKECIIGAGALILKDAPDGCVYAAGGTEPSKVPSSRLKKI